MAGKLRIFLWGHCYRDCGGCCNKRWDTSRLPCCTHKDIEGASEVLLTGGEPLIFPWEVHDVIRTIRRANHRARIHVYTAMLTDPEAAHGVLMAADGMTVTLHEDSDVIPFMQFSEGIPVDHGRSLRLNVFKGITVFPDSDWKVKAGIEWIPDCPLPAGERFVQWSKLKLERSKP